MAGTARLHHAPDPSVSVGGNAGCGVGRRRWYPCPMPGRHTPRGVPRLSRPARPPTVCVRACHLPLHGGASLPDLPEHAKPSLGVSSHGTNGRTPSPAARVSVLAGGASGCPCADLAPLPTYALGCAHDLGRSSRAVGGQELTRLYLGAGASSGARQSPAGGHGHADVRALSPCERALSARLG